MSPIASDSLISIVVWLARPIRSRSVAGLNPGDTAAENASIPYFAIGGLDTDTVGDVIAAGATRFAVVRAIAQAQDPELAARRLLAAARQGTLSGAS